MDTTWTLEELATETGLTPRTIRGYIERGLLPGPATRGRGARYGERHMSRLRCIQALKEAAPLGLDEIRQVLLSLDDERIRAIGAGEEPVMALPIGAGVVSASRSGPGLSTPDYIASVRQQARGVSRSRLPTGTRATSTRAGSGVASGLERLVEVLRQSTSRGRVQRKARAEWWASIPVTPDVEIRVRGLDDHDIRRLERAADHLRHVLMSEDVTDTPGGPRKPGRRSKK